MGIVPRNEEAAERAFAAADNDLRYHFNLPGTLKPTDLVSVTLTRSICMMANRIPATASKSISMACWSSLEILIRAAELGVDYTTPQFTLASVNAQVGLGADNIVSLRGINYNAEGGGNWMGIDYVQLNGAAEPPLAFLPPAVSNGQVALNWTGTGNLEWAPTLLGPWTPITPAPGKPYAEAIVTAQNRFYRLRKP